MSGQPPCCAATRDASSSSVAVDLSMPERSATQEPGKPGGRSTRESPGGRSTRESMVRLDGGTFLMGTDDGDGGYPADGEGPVREIRLDPFWIDPTTVTNAAFAEFTDATGWITLAERFGTSFVFASFLPDGFPETRAVVEAPWWREVHGADWRHPDGPDSSIDDRMDHPVIQVTWRDARAYAKWASKRLPTEAEWEYAARGGLVQARYPWGDEREPGGRHLMNVWQGTFPTTNTADDGYLATAPADAFAPNGYGLHNMTGNVWEWCADWFHPRFHATGPRDNPTGPPRTDRKVMRGGSYLCHESYCFRYRVDARSSNTPDSSAGNIGFRCAASI